MVNKKTLDNLMQEYDYEKNTTEDTLYFLSFMFDQYEKINKK